MKALLVMAMCFLALSLAACTRSRSEASPEALAARAAPPLPLVAPKPMPTPGPLLESSRPHIAMQIMSWGQLVASFLVDDAGDGEYRETRQVDGVYNYDVLIKRLQVGQQGFAKLQAMTSAIEKRTSGRSVSCGDVPTDGPYGQFSWMWPGSKGTLFLQYGCRTQDGSEVLLLVNRVEKVVLEWAKPLPVAEIQEIRQPPSN